LENRMVCWCSKVTEGDIIGAIAKGARTLEDVKAMTGACTLMRCKELHPEGRCCSKDILDILSRFAEGREADASGCG
jgi:bacterioferritin-associated ferredoxin